MLISVFLPPYISIFLDIQIYEKGDFIYALYILFTSFIGWSST